MCSGRVPKTMARRMTDTAKWDDAWFMGLSASAKLLWFYLCDECDHAGIWNVNRRLAEFKIGCGVSWEDCLHELGDRVTVMPCGERWHIGKFVEFQYGPTPNAANKAHKGVLRLLAIHALPWSFDGASKGHRRGLEGAKEKEKEKALDKEKVKDSFSNAEVDQMDIGSPAIAQAAPVSDYDHWHMHEKLQPDTGALLDDFCKIGPQNWRQWRKLITTWTLPAVLSASRGVPATERWPDRVEQTLAASRGQENPGDACAHKIVKMDLSS